MNHLKLSLKEAVEWKREIDHFPGISPVNVKFRLGDGYKWQGNSSCIWNTANA